MCNIRRATAGDFPAIITIWEEAVWATHCFLGEDEIAFYKERMQEYLDAVELSVFENNGRIKGFSGVAGDKLEMLFVAERGAGIGSVLLQDAIGKGVRKVDVNEQNQQAAGFYKAKGFGRTGRSQTDSEGKPHPILFLELGLRTTDGKRLKLRNDNKSKYLKV